VSSSVRVRFAPSPTGHLHVGNARTALFNWLFARGRAGAVVLRIEDTDAERSTSEAMAAIQRDLAWLGIDWDEGPDVGGPHGPYRQSERRAMYESAARQLLDRGDAYRCFCSVERIAAEREAQRRSGAPPRYSGTCRSVPGPESDARARTEPFVTRFRVTADSVRFQDMIRGPVEFPGSQIGDPVILRGDGSPTYNFAVVADDIAMKITHVVRGEDHLSNTPRQILIYRALEEKPPAFAHLPMVLGSDGHPLSKRHGASSVADFRARGFLPEALANYLVLLGWAHPSGREVLSNQEILSEFSLERVGLAAAMFDIKKLTWLNAHYIRAASSEALSEACRADLEAAGFVSRDPLPGPVKDWVIQAVGLFAGQMETLRDAVPATRSLFRFEELVQDATGGAAPVLRSLAGEPGAARVVSRFAQQVESLTPPLLLDRESFRAVAVAVGRDTGTKGRSLYHPIRVAITASETGPELDRLVPLIDRGSLLELSPPLSSCGRRARSVAALLEGGTWIA